jgi:hypothetical protein
MIVRLSIEDAQFVRRLLQIVLEDEKRLANVTTGRTQQEPTTVKRAADVLGLLDSQIMGRPRHDGALIDELAAVLKLDGGRSVLNANALTTLRKLILIPDELMELKQHLKEAGCVNCGKPLRDYFLAIAGPAPGEVFCLGCRGVVIGCLGCGRPKTIPPELLALIKERCDTCKEHGGTAPNEYEAVFLEEGNGGDQDDDDEDREEADPTEDPF